MLFLAQYVSHDSIDVHDGQRLDTVMVQPSIKFRAAHEGFSGNSHGWKRREPTMNPRTNGSHRNA
jgi:hypothetical protein